MKLWMKILMLVAAFGILYVSFARAGLEEVTNDEKYDRLRKVLISYQKINQGDNFCYRLPESRTLPNNPLYFFKKIRDDFWIQFSKNPIDETRIVVLVADKKVYESILMYEDKTIKPIFWQENMKEAEEKIRLSREVANQLPKSDLEVEQLIKKVNEAEDFYNYTLEQMKLGNKIVRCHE